MYGQVKEIIFEKLRPEAKMPAKAHPTDNGFDLFSAMEVNVMPGETTVVDTGIRCQFPPDVYMLISSKSGLAAKHSISVKNSPGLIDNSYVGEISVILHNSHKWKEYKVGVGDKIAQAIMMYDPNKFFFTEGKVDLNTERGANGFGSSGK